MVVRSPAVFDLGKLNRMNQQYIKATVKEFKLKAKDVFMPVRCALTGLVHGPDLHLIMAVWGRQETARRLDRF
jgi:nondiscriminating glutamyl-tRNA synthetase